MLDSPQSFNFADVFDHPLFHPQLQPVIAFADAKKRDYYKKKYKILDYHIGLFEWFTRSINIRSKNVLEIGGSVMPAELCITEGGANKWVCVDAVTDYYKSPRPELSHHNSASMYKFNDISFSDAIKNDYIIYDEKAEDIPDDFSDYFDICVSHAAFEHITMLPMALSTIYKSLKKGGVLYATVAPIWSGAHGIHESINDTDFKLFPSDWPSALDHAHLLMGYSELFSHLEKIYSLEVAEKYTYRLKHNTLFSVNKLFFEDYCFLMHKAQFTKKHVFPLAGDKLPESKLQKLMSMYPGYKRFDVRGIGIHAIK